MTCLADRCEYVNKNNNNNNYYGDNTRVSGLESFKMAYDSPPRRLISYTDQTAAMHNNISLSEPCQRDGVYWWSDGKRSSNQHPYFLKGLVNVSRRSQPQIVQCIDTQKEREAFVVRLLRRPWTENKMPCMPMFISREQLHFYPNNGEVSSLLYTSVVSYDKSRLY